MNKPTPKERLSTALTKTAEKIAVEQAEKAARRANGYHYKGRPGYIVRIELHGVENSQDYHKLHTYLEEHSFSTEITNDEGDKFQLPTATYYFDNSANKHSYRAVHHMAALGVQAALEGDYAHVKAANSIPTILVTMTSSIFWSGLSDAE